MKVVTVEEAARHLSDLIAEALEGEEIVIRRGETPLIRLVVHEEARPRRRPGSIPGLVVRMSDEFDAPLPDFRDCVE
ncbi:MAG: type II toxin-antitoxin system prevent-host-death family antitoxin [Armatimonadetes bacterium]|nr:type II toxin-antitoxin system prevent-host-death family antitoxin [Armatimonadota bacterium]